MDWKDLKNRWQTAWGSTPKAALMLPDKVRSELEPTINFLTRIGKLEVVLELISEHKVLYQDPWLYDLEATTRYAIAVRQQEVPDELLAPLMSEAEEYWPEETDPDEATPSQPIVSQAKPKLPLVVHRQPKTLDCDDDPPEPFDEDDLLDNECSEELPDTSSNAPTGQLDADDLDLDSNEPDEPELIPADQHRRDDERIVDIDIELSLEEIQITEIDDPDSGWTADFDPDLEDFLVDSEQIDKEDIEPTSKLTREIKARQIAAEVIDRHDWPIKSLPLLSEIFTHSGYGATRVALERLMSQGLTLEELILATHIKALWSNSPAYWICFSSSGDGYDTQFLLSWPAALSILNAFTSLPSLEEVEVFLDEQFEYWTSNHSLRRSFKSFRMYIWFRTARLHATLCPTEWQNFDANPYARWS